MKCLGVNASATERVEVFNFPNGCEVIFSLTLTHCYLIHVCLFFWISIQEVRGVTHTRPQRPESLQEDGVKAAPLPAPRPVPSWCHLALFFKIPAVREAEPAFAFSGLASPAVFLVWSTWCKSRGSGTFFPRSCSNETLCFEWRFSFAKTPFGKEWWKVKKSCKNNAGQRQRAVTERTVWSFDSNYNNCSFKWQQTNPFPSSFGFNC